MLKVIIELVPGGDEEKSRVLGVATISNDLVESSETNGRLGSYLVRLSKWAPNQNQIWKKGKVEGFDRKRKGPWDLLYVALRNTIGGRNK